MTPTNKEEVIIVGGGPVGLCLAMLLGEKGVAVRVLEQVTEIEEDLRASTFHPPTLDMLEPYGVTAAILAQGLICGNWQIRLHPSGDRAVFDLSVLEDDTKHPYRLQSEQWKLSKALLVAVERLPQVQVTFGARVVAVEPGDDAVTVRFETASGTEELRAMYVVGCDGSRSVVRGSIGLSFEGTTYPETTLLATTTFPFEDHLEGLSNVSYCWKQDGNFSLLKVPGRWRVSIYPDENKPIEEQITDEAINRSMQEIVQRDCAYEVRESRPYRVHMRIASDYRRGRVLLAGDAAHLNSPSGGMGLNGGLHDAFELANALVDVLRNGAAEERLDLYGRRRRTVAQNEILLQADRNRARMRERAPERRLEMLRELQAITRDRERMRAHLRKSSMLDGLALAAQIK
jgi:2-polyprenyl-6-methoxyphenol hydroxylase-like FAD-dependent oxidoreductase